MSEIAAKVLGFLVPYALGKGEQLAKDLGQDAVDKMADWLDRLRKRWSGDDEALDALDSFEAAPAEGADALEEVLASRLEADAALRASTEQLVSDVGPVVIVRIKGGEVAVQRGAVIDEIARGTVVHEQEVQTGEVQSGPRIGRIS